MHTLLRRVRGRVVRSSGTPQRAHAGVDRSRLTRRRVAAVLCAVAAAWVAFAVYNETAQSRAADQQVQRLEQQNDALRQQIAVRVREIADARSDSWLAQELRRQGYVKNGESVYVPVSPGQSLPAGGGIDPGPLPSFSAAAPASPSPVQSRPPVEIGGTPAPPTPVYVPGR